MEFIVSSTDCPNTIVACTNDVKYFLSKSNTLRENKNMICPGVEARYKSLDICPWLHVILQCELSYDRKYYPTVTQVGLVFCLITSTKSKIHIRSLNLLVVQSARFLICLYLGADFEGKVFVGDLNRSEWKAKCLRHNGKQHHITNMISHNKSFGSSVGTIYKTKEKPVFIIVICYCTL